MGSRFAATGYQDSDLKEDLAGTSGCVSLRPSRLRVASLSAPKTWKLLSLDIRDGCRRIHSIARLIFVLSSNGVRRRSQRIWKLRVPAYGLNDAPAALYRTLDEFRRESSAVKL